MIAFDLEYVPEGSVDGPIAPPRRDLREVYCEIIQIGAVKLDSVGRAIDTLDLLIRPSFISHIPEWHVNLVGITEADREHGITFEEGLGQFLNFIGHDTDIWVFYGDAWVLPNSVKKHGLETSLPEVRQLKPELDKFGITKEQFDGLGLEFCSGNLHKVLNISIPGDQLAHNALHDARSLAHSIYLLRHRVGNV